MKKLFLCTALVVFLLSLGVVVETAAGDVPPLMTGVIRDRNSGTPIQNARVFFYGSGYGFANTDSSGRYTFTLSQISSFGGAISGTLYAGAAGYFEATPVSVSDLSAQPVLPVVNDISLPPGGSMVVGVVRDDSTGLGISGASVSFNRNPMCTFLGGGTTESVQTATDGSYSIDSSYFNESGISSGFSINLMVNTGGYIGASQSISFSNYPVTQDFRLLPSTGTLMTGVIRDRNSGAPIQNARVFFYGSGYGFTNTDDSGIYTFTLSQISSFGGVLSGTLYAGAAGYFEAIPVSVSDLSAQPVLPVVNDISLPSGGPMVVGVVRDDSTGLGRSGASVSFNRNPMCTFLGGGTTESVQTETDGSYSIDSSYFNESGISSGFSINLMVNSGGYIGASRSISFSNYPVTQDFRLLSSSATLIAGNAGVADVTLSYTDGIAKTAISDSSCNYSIAVSYNWSGAVTPSMTGYMFSPTSRIYSNVIVNQTGQDYTAIPITCVISGSVKTSSGYAISEISISFSNGGGTATTDSSGNYSIPVPNGYTGIATPSKTGYTFSPASKPYSNVTANKSDENYTATPFTNPIIALLRCE